MGSTTSVIGSRKILRFYTSESFVYLTVQNIVLIDCINGEHFFSNYVPKNFEVSSAVVTGITYYIVLNRIVQMLDVSSSFELTCIGVYGCIE